MNKQLICFTVLMLIYSYSASSEWQQQFALSYVSPDIKVNKLPVEIRDVAIHPEDTYVPASNAGPVAQLQYALEGTVHFKWRWSKTINRSGLKSGFALQWLIYPTTALYDHALRNYSNAVGTQQRGVGAALTFVGLEKRGVIADFNSDTWDDLLFNISPEFFIQSSVFSDNYTLIAAISYYQLQAVTGWDRFTALEEKDHFTLAQVLPITLAFQSNDFKLGLVYPLIASKTNYGKNADITTSISLLLAYHW